MCCAVGRVPSVLIELEQVLTEALQTAFPGLEERALLAPCRDPKFGDYQCNNAMALFAKMKGKVVNLHPVQSNLYLMTDDWSTCQTVLCSLHLPSAFSICTFGI